MSSSAAFLSSRKDGVLVRLWVTPRASRNQISGVTGDRLKVRVAAPPVDSAANDELILFLSNALNMPRRQFKLVRGHSHRTKDILIKDARPEAVEKALSSHP